MDLFEGLRIAEPAEEAAPRHGAPPPRAWAWVTPFLEAAAAGGDCHAAELLGRSKRLVHLPAFPQMPFSTFGPSRNVVLAARRPTYARANAPRLVFVPAALRDHLLGPGARAGELVASLPAHEKSGNLVWGGAYPLSFPTVTAMATFTEALFRLVCLASGIRTLPVKYGPDHGLDAFSVVPHGGALCFLSVDCKQRGTRQYSSLMCPDGIHERLLSHLERAGPRRHRGDCGILLRFAALCVSARRSTTAVVGNPPFLVCGGVAFPAKSGKRQGLKLYVNRQTLVPSPEDHQPQPPKGENEVFLDFPLEGAVATLRTLLQAIASVEENEALSHEAVVVHDSDDGPLAAAADFVADVGSRHHFRRQFSHLRHFAEMD